MGFYSNIYRRINENPDVVSLTMAHNLPFMLLSEIGVLLLWSTWNSRKRKISCDL
jgi:hypothetical protein